MLLGVIADDFTGASDIANTLAKGGLVDRAVPRRADEAGARGLRGRRRRAEEPLDRRRRGGRALAGGARLAAGAGLPAVRLQVLLDLRIRRRRAISARSARRWRRRSASKGVVACPAFPTAGRTVYQGHLFVGDRLLNESGPREPSAQPDDRPGPAALARPAVRGAGRARALGRSCSRAARRCARRSTPRPARGERLVDRRRDLRRRPARRSATPAPRRRSSPAARASRSACRATSSARASRPARAAPSRASTAPEAILAGCCSKATLAADRGASRGPSGAAGRGRGGDGGRRHAGRARRLRARARGRGAARLFLGAAREGARRCRSAYGREASPRALDALFAETARAPRR